jgi:glycosyltransferase involved in cell wall biosynthesis
MKILQIIDTFKCGGAQRRLVQLMDGLIRSGHQVELILLDEDIFFSEIRSFDMKIHVLKRRSILDLKFFFALLNLIKDIDPDCIHSWNYIVTYYSVIASKLLGIKHINGMITDAYRHRIWNRVWWISRMTFPLSDKVFANSYAGLKSYNVPRSKAVCIHNGFDFHRIGKLEEKNSIRKKFNIDTEYVIGMVGRFSFMKDYKTFVDVANRVLQGRKDITFIAVGDGDSLEYYKSRVHEDVKEYMKFLGAQSNVESIANTFDIGVLTSFHEGISNAIMEYMALGKPVIATEGGGTEELVIDGSTGFIVGVEDKDAIVEKIQYLIDNKETTRTMGQNGRERLENEFSAELMVQKFIGLYNSLASTE